jgi:hypothetical protein
MKRFKFTKITIFLILIFSCALLSFGQERNSALCDEVESKMIKAFKPIRTGRNIYLQDECMFYLYFNDKTKIKISLKKYRSQAGSSQDIKEYLGLFTIGDDRNYPPKHRYKTINQDNYWDQAIAYKNNVPDHFILLRYQNYAIHLLSPNFRLLKKAEKVLRSIRL